MDILIRGVESIDLQCTKMPETPEEQKYAIKLLIVNNYAMYEKSSGVDIPPFLVEELEEFQRLHEKFNLFATAVSFNLQLYLSLTATGNSGEVKKSLVDRVGVVSCLSHEMLHKFDDTALEMLQKRSGIHIASWDLKKAFSTCEADFYSASKSTLSVYLTEFLRNLSKDPSRMPCSLTEVFEQISVKSPNEIFSFKDMAAMLLLMALNIHFIVDENYAKNKAAYQSYFEAKVGV